MTSWKGFSISGHLGALCRNRGRTADFEKLLGVLERNNVMLNRRKCQFFDSEIENLRYEISQDVIKPSGGKTLEFPAPKNFHSVR